MRPCRRPAHQRSKFVSYLTSPVAICPAAVAAQAVEKPPSARGPRVSTPFSTVCATAVAYLCLLFYTPGVRHRKWQNEKGFWVLVKIHRASFSINSCCCNFIFDFLLCSLRDLLTAKATALAAIAYRNFPKSCCQSPPLPSWYNPYLIGWCLLYAFSSFVMCHITYGAIIRLSTYCKVHSQIQLVSCCEGFPSHLKERFLHFNNRIIPLFGTDCMNQFVYFSYIILLVY